MDIVTSTLSKFSAAELWDKNTDPRVAAYPLMRSLPIELAIGLITFAAIVRSRVLGPRKGDSLKPLLLIQNGKLMVICVPRN